MSVQNGLDAAFVRSREENRAALIPYITGGFPQPERFINVAIAALEAGADALEIGIPFSDPLLDGPAIQRSQQQALEAGVTPADCLRYATRISQRTGKPLLFMGAYNPILAFGVSRFCREAGSAGVDGLIVPDVPFEEQDELRAGAEEHGLHLIQMVAPTSTSERLERACALASGFVYCLSVAGVTGARASVAATARPLVEAVRAQTEVPVAVGFGIAGPEQAREVASFADGVIVGSAMINLIAASDGEACQKAVADFVSSLRDAASGQGMEPAAKR